MSALGSRAWLLSACLHLLFLGAGVSLLSFGSSPPRSVVRMHLSAPGRAATTKRSLKANDSTWWTTAKTLIPGGSLLEPKPPGWQTPGSSTNSAAPPVPVSASLEELLGPSTPSAVAAPSTARSEASASGWSNASGEGYDPPPLPPPSLTPPQGARWVLVVSVPAGGGGASGIEGLDSGHPELDRWLETYLRTVSFPSSPDGTPYQTQWILRLDSGKPQ